MIWQEGRGTRPEVYHTKRMQRCLSYTPLVQRGETVVMRTLAESCRPCSPPIPSSFFQALMTGTFVSGKPMPPTWHITTPIGLIKVHTHSHGRHGTRVNAQPRPPPC